MDVIHIHDLEVFYRVGVPDAERATAQRLLLDLKLHLDFGATAASDDISKTINYFEVTQRLLTFGENRQWKLIEKLAEDIAQMILTDFHPARVQVEVKKFIIPQARHIAVFIDRSAGSA